jgi:hypothetical protein
MEQRVINAVEMDPFTIYCGLVFWRRFFSRLRNRTTEYRDKKKLITCSGLLKL